MAKSTKKKKNRKLRRQIRKTVGALFMISAIVVAALPVTDVSAEDPTTSAEKVKVLNIDKDGNYDTITGSTGAVDSAWQSKVPYIDEDTEIYTDETGRFQFVFMQASDSSASDVAIIMGADTTSLENGKLTIPKDVDAYKKYMANTSDSGFCAVNRRGKYLYYQVSTHASTADGALLFENLTVNELDQYGVRTGNKATISDVTSNLNEMQQKNGSWYFIQSEGYYESETNPETGKEERVLKRKDIEYYATPKLTTSYAPCDRENSSDWEDVQLYYWEKEGVTTDDPSDEDGFRQVEVSDKTNQRIHDAAVQYIARQRAISDGTGSGTWHVGPEAKESAEDKGVFYSDSGIVDLVIEANLIGIGDYAFNRCGGIQSVTFNGNVNTIGNGAFMNCNSMGTVKFQNADGTIALHTGLNILGRKAFSGCSALTQFDLPVSVYAIGDYCFENCVGLTNIYMCAENGEEGKIYTPNLNMVGINAFKGCSSLASLTFPASYSEKLPVTYLDGCTGLQYIKSNDKDFDIIDGTEAEFGTGTDGEDSAAHGDGTACDITKFLTDLTYSDSFYFEGNNDYLLHQTAKDHSAAYKYADTDPVRYEKVIKCPEKENTETGAPHEATYIIEVVEQEEGLPTVSKLVAMEIDPKCKEVEIPGSIGGYGVETIDTGSFKDNCFLTKITIPNTVKNIKSGAFQGCHNLKWVIFSQPNNPELVIGQGAFNTQEVSSHMIGCDGKMDSKPFLSFTGDISDSQRASGLSAPFEYAMNPQNRIDAGNQSENCFITYYSGWPTNLVVKYNYNKDTGEGENELIDYPKSYELQDKYKKFDISDAENDDLPYITQEYAEAAKTAWDTVMAYDSGASTQEPSKLQRDIVNAVQYINLPTGITAIADGIFSTVGTTGEKDFKDDAGNPAKANEQVKTITLNSVNKIDPYTFAECKNLIGAYIPGGEEIGNYAFKDCINLEKVEIGNTVSELGIRPFAGCTKLNGVDFLENPNFVCSNKIIFGTANGAKTSVVECLETRGGIVKAEELTGITKMSEEAFKDCSSINNIDLSETNMTDIPKQCFAFMGALSGITLSNSITSIKEGAFWEDPLLYDVFIPNNNIHIADYAFADVLTEDGEIVYQDKSAGIPKTETRSDDEIIFSCNEGSAAAIYAENYNYITSDTFRLVKYLVIPQGVKNAAPVTVDTVAIPTSVLSDTKNWETNKFKYEPYIGNANLYPEYQYEGYTFLEWGEYTEEDGMLQSYAVYSEAEEVPEISFWAKSPIDSGATYELVDTIPRDDRFEEPNLNDAKYEKWHFDGYTFDGWTYSGVNAFANYSGRDCTVTFIDTRNTTQKMFTVTKTPGTQLTSEEIPTSADTEHFLKWEGEDGATIRDKIYGDITFYATYDNEPTSNPSGSPGTSASPNPSSSSNPASSASPSSSPSASPEVTKYTVSVSGGSGSGSYPAGAIVAINAYYLGEGQSFDKWTTSTAGVGFANPSASSTTFTMPAANVAVTATYKTGNSSSGAAGGAGGGSGVSAANTNTGSTVQVTKPGFSNTGLAGATVSGATDNFIIKVSEDQSASDAVLAALQAKYGDLSRIKYFPMDISLYDSTGRTKIADTSGISVNITLPLPDELIQYAGNNKAAAVANGSLEELNARFTTIDGIPCINFTATHFSPYVIYVDTANLTEGTIDVTPKTGDPIHPKWFLAIGMACISLILFFKKDKTVVRPKSA